MKVDIKVPGMGESISEATVGTIIKPTGSLVAMDDEVVELETDKVNQVLYAPQAGVVHLTVNSEEVVKIGQVIGYVDTGQAVEVLANSEMPAAAVEEKPLSKEKQELSAAPKAEQSKVLQRQVGMTARLTKELWLEELKTGAGKKVQEESSAKRKEVPAPRSETRVKMSKIRRVIASRLVEVKQSTAMLTTFNEADMTEIIELREKYKEAFAKAHGVKLGFMSFFVKACASALLEFPQINSYIDGEELVHREYVDIGIAVGTERGLIVPVVRDCDKLTFAGVEQSIEAYAKKARSGGLSVDDLQGGGFTITNGGVYGSLLSTPILNPPQCAILGMHKIMKRPVVIDDQIVVRQMMYLAMSYDHRIVDGKEAVSFLVHVKNCLEDPTRLQLEV